MNESFFYTLKKLLKILFRRFPLQTPILLTLMVLSGVTEGISMALVLPMLSLLGVGNSDGISILERLLSKFFEFLGVVPDLQTVLVVFVIVAFTQALFFMCQGWLAARIQHQLVKEWRLNLLKSCLDSHWSFLSSIRGGDFVNGIVLETFRAGGALFLIFQFASGIVITLVYVALTFMASWITTLSLVGGACFMLLMTRWIVVRARRIGQKMVKYNEAVTSFVGEVFSGMKTVKASAYEKYVYDKISGDVESLRSLGTINSFDPCLIRAIFEVFSIVLFAGILVAGAGKFDIPLALVLLVIAAFVRLVPRIMQMQQHLQTMNSIFPSVQRIFLLTRKAETSLPDFSAKSTGKKVNYTPDIILKDLSVTYGDHRVIKNVSINISAKQTTAIIGASGSGKTTLVDCILGLANYQKGEIFIEGKSVKELDIHSWRGRVGYVGQETFLFNTTIRENLMVGNPGASDEEIEAAVRMANADEFIEALPNKYDTMVGDRGVCLSGGQRQRLGLARALIGNKALLILDEATSALDSISEANVLEALKKMQGKITIVTIAHRLSSVRNADKIYVLDHGEMVESGDWQQLIKSKGLFHEFLAKQQGQTSGGTI